jgi:hypothetical protein
VLNRRGLASKANQPENVLSVLLDRSLRNSGGAREKPRGLVLNEDSEECGHRVGSFVSWRAGASRALLRQADLLAQPARQRGSLDNHVDGRGDHANCCGTVK